MNRLTLLWCLVFLILCLVGCNNNEGGIDGDADAIDAVDSENGFDNEVNSESEVEDEWQPEKNFEYTEERESCKNFNPYRNLYFGDLHAHSRFSWDAYGYDLRASVEDAWSYAKGKSIKLTPLDENGNGTREVKNERPLDFAAITDHIEYFAEYKLCTEETSLVYNTDLCEQYRKGGHQFVTKLGLTLAANNPEKYEELCGSDGKLCSENTKTVWKEIVTAADKAYDKTRECSFTAFSGYEYTNSNSVVNYHRNVVFRNSIVPELPPSYFEQDTLDGFYDEIEQKCTKAETGCDVLVIPHNSNWSNGTMFTIKDENYKSEQDKIAKLKKRAVLEPVFEVFQHKGDMECKNGFEGIEYDPLCEFEKIRESDFQDCGEGTGIGGANSFGCLSKLDYVRNVYLYGLKQKYLTGYNPYKFGLIGSTDTHNAAPGMVSERKIAGHIGNVDDSEIKRLTGGTNTHQPLNYNPGGLIAVWSQENSRDAIFESIRQSEVYSTSGPRISVRFFGGWEISEDICFSDNLVYQGYKNGVPMGSDLPENTDTETKPVFVVDAYADLGTESDPGTKLQMVQIIKGWIDKAGNTHHKIIEIAGNSLNGATVDEETCETEGEGEEHLCGVFVDTEFDPDEEAFYYARVVENPSCRWISYDCINQPVGEKPDVCSDSAYIKTVQERALTSPIWYEK